LFAHSDVRANRGERVRAGKLFERNSTNASELCHHIAVHLQNTGDRSRVTRTSPSVLARRSEAYAEAHARDPSPVWHKDIPVAIAGALCQASVALSGLPLSVTNPRALPMFRASRDPLRQVGRLWSRALEARTFRRLRAESAFNRAT